MTPVTKPAEFRLTRVFDAPREAVFAAFADSRALVHWWGPKGFDLEVRRLEFRPGGAFHYAMRTGNSEMWGLFEYVAIAAPERLEYISAFSNAAGDVVPAPFPGNFPLRTHNVIDFREVEGRTELSLRSWPLDASPEEEAFFAGMTDSMNAGFGGTWLKLDRYLADPERNLELTRQYAASPERVFAAFSDPVGISDWWGPVGFTTTTHAMDFREGGEWRFTMHGPDGTDYANIVRYRQIAPGRRLAYAHRNPEATIAFDVEIDLTPVGEGTELRFRLRFVSPEVRTEMADWGAREGLADTLGRLAQKLG